MKQEIVLAVVDIIYGFAAKSDRIGESVVTHRFHEPVWSLLNIRGASVSKQSLHSDDLGSRVQIDVVEESSGNSVGHVDIGKEHCRPRLK